MPAGDGTGAPSGPDKLPYRAVTRGSTVPLPGPTQAGQKCIETDLNRFTTIQWMRDFKWHLGTKHDLVHTHMNMNWGNHDPNAGLIMLHELNRKYATPWPSMHPSS